MREDIEQRRDACEQDETDNVLELAARVVERVIAVTVENVRVKTELSSRFDR